jgi:predicted small metal-binding protein
MKRCRGAVNPGLTVASVAIVRIGFAASPAACGGRPASAGFIAFLRPGQTHLPQIVSGRARGRFHMARMYIDCRDYPSEMNCTVAISADSRQELLDAAVQHAVAVHRHQDTPELREQIGKLIKSQ